MIRLAPPQRDLIMVVLLVLILLTAFLVLSALFAERSPALQPPVLTPAPTVTPTTIGELKTSRTVEDPAPFAG